MPFTTARGQLWDAQVGPRTVGWGGPAAGTSRCFLGRCALLAPDVLQRWQSFLQR